MGKARHSMAASSDRNTSLHNNVITLCLHNTRARTDTGSLRPHITRTRTETRFSDHDFPPVFCRKLASNASWSDPRCLRLIVHCSTLQARGHLQPLAKCEKDRQFADSFLSRTNFSLSPLALAENFSRFPACDRRCTGSIDREKELLLELLVSDPCLPPSSEQLGNVVEPARVLLFCEASGLLFDFFLFRKSLPRSTIEPNIGSFFSLATFFNFLIYFLFFYSSSLCSTYAGVSLIWYFRWLNKA